MSFSDTESRRRHAISLLRHRSEDVAPARINSPAAACINRGQLLHRIHGTARADDALGQIIRQTRVMETDEELQRIAFENLETALNSNDGGRQAGRPLVIGDPVSERRLQTRRELTFVRGLLASPSSLA